MGIWHPVPPTFFITTSSGGTVLWEPSAQALRGWWRMEMFPCRWQCRLQEWVLQGGLKDWGEEACGTE